MNHKKHPTVVYRMIYKPNLARVVPIDWKLWLASQDLSSKFIFPPDLQPDRKNTRIHAKKSLAVLSGKTALVPSAFLSDRIGSNRGASRTLALCCKDLAY